MNKISSKHIFLLASALWIGGIMWSRFAISIGMVLMIVAAFWGGEISSKFKRFISNKYYLAITGIFLIFSHIGIVVG